MAFLAIWLPLPTSGHAGAGGRVARRATAPAQPDPTRRPPTPTDRATVDATSDDLPLQVQSLAQNVDLLKAMVTAQLQGNTVGIEAMREANQRHFQLLAILSGVATLFGIATWFRARQEHQDYQHERTFYEARAERLEKRHQEGHEASVALQRNAGTLLELQEVGLRRVNEITTAIAAGAERNVNSLNTIIQTFERIMAFKVQEAEEAKKLRDRMDEYQSFQAAMSRRLDELQTAQREQVEELLRRALELRLPRYRFASPDPDLQRRIVEFRTQMDLVQRSILVQHTGLQDPARNQAYGEVYLRRGVIAYYDNDIVRARTMLRTAEQYFPFSEQALSGITREQKIAIAFTQFYLALIEKNYGEIGAARAHIENAFAAFGRDEPDEILTPTTRAEILSNLGDMSVARDAILQLLERVKNRRERHNLPQHDAVYANRAWLLLGNTYFVQGQWDQALRVYEEALGQAGDTGDYFVSYAIAQVHAKNGQEAEAAARLRESHEALLRSDHLRTKTALDTRILLHTLGFLCMRATDRALAERYATTLRELSSRIREVEGLQLRLFSFEQKRLVSKDEFLAEVFPAVSARVA